MDDDKQIMDPVAQTKQYFLSDDLLAGEPKVSQYSLAGEFARARKNRNTLVYVLVLVYILTLGFGAFILINNENIKNNKLNVNISDFKQLNLTELLNTKKKADQKISDLQKELENLQEELKRETARVKQSSLTESQILSLKNLSAEEQKKRIAELQKIQTEQINKLTDNYNQKIKQKEAELAEYQKKATTETEKLTRAVKQNQDLLSQYQNAAEFRLQKQQQEYEAKLAQLKSIQQAEIEALKNEHSRYAQALTSRINQLQKANNDNLELIKNIQGSLSNYQYAMNSLAAEKRENGYVIDPRDRNRIMVFIYTIYPVKKGDIAFIFKEEPNSPIAKIQLTPEGDQITARIIEAYSDVKIKPFDKILLVLEGKQ
ncbi:MAG: hypothetical protein K6U80_11865 [Firmicutes bacterium]|nr:hypothetical protein [Bacillota bacterium]